ncbi:MAG: hypothetical protein ABR973_06160 [Candidatus Acidiferrales bacterium]|jgi:hypothetical protein
MSSSSGPHIHEVEDDGTAWSAVRDDIERLSAEFTTIASMMATWAVVLEDEVEFLLLFVGTDDDVGRVDAHLWCIMFPAG